MGPVAGAAERSQQEVSDALTLKRERCKMFRALAMCANSVVFRLGDRDSPVPPGDDDVGTYLHFFA